MYLIHTSILLGGCFLYYWLLLKIHGVSPEFLKKNKRDGDDLDDLIDYKIRGRNRD